MAVFRRGVWTTILSDGLVPGDLVSLHREAVERPLPCDFLLLSGEVSRIFLQNKTFSA